MNRQSITPTNNQGMENEDLEGSRSPTGQKEEQTPQLLRDDTPRNKETSKKLHEESRKQFFFSDVPKVELWKIIAALVVLLISVVVAWIIVAVVNGKDDTNDNEGMPHRRSYGVTEWLNETLVTLDNRHRLSGGIHELEMTPNGQFVAVIAPFPEETPRVYERTKNGDGRDEWEALPIIPLPEPISVWSAIVQMAGGDDSIPLTVAIADPLAIDNYLHVFEFLASERRWSMLGNGGIPFLEGENPGRGNANRFSMSRTTEHGVRLATSSALCLDRSGTERLAQEGVRMYALNTSAVGSSWMVAMDDYCTTKRPDGISLSTDGSTLAVGVNDVYGRGLGHVRVFRWIESSRDLHSDTEYLLQKGQCEIISIVSGGHNGYGVQSMELNADGTRLAVQHGKKGFYRVYEYSSVWLPVGGELSSDIVLPETRRNSRIRLSQDGRTLVAGYTISVAEEVKNEEEDEKVEGDSEATKTFYNYYGEVQMFQFIQDDDDVGAWRSVGLIHPKTVNETARLVTDIAISSEMATWEDGNDPLMPTSVVIALFQSHLPQLRFYNAAYSASKANCTNRFIQKLQDADKV